MDLVVRDGYIHQTEDHLLWLHHVMNDREQGGEKNETVALVRNRCPGGLHQCRRPNVGGGPRHRTAKARAIHAIWVIPNGGGLNREDYIGTGPSGVEGFQWDM